ncbi:MAG: glutathione S-transferase family protein, partial [Sedimentitalea sp.]
ACSSNVQAVMWGLAELGVAVTRVDVGGRFGGLDTADFRAMNPNGLIPVLRDRDGLVVFESAAILRHFSESDPVVDQWGEWGKHTFGAAFTVPVFWAHWRTPEAERNAAAVAAAVSRFEALMGIVAPLIAQKGYVCGDRLSLADIWIGHVLFRYFTLGIARAPHSVFEDYYARLCARPAYRDHVMLDYTHLKGETT